MAEVSVDEGSAADALKKRYGSTDIDPGRDWNETLAVLLRHRSVRNFLPRKVDARTLELIVAAAQSASTSSNLQLCTVIAVEDQSRKDRLAKLAGNQRHVSEAAMMLV